MHEASFGQVVLDGGRDIDMAVMATYRGGYPELSAALDQEAPPVLLTPRESEIVIDGLKKIIADPYFPAFHKALARGMMTGIRTQVKVNS